MKTYILFIYLATWNPNSGMTATTAEFQSLDRCRIAAERVKQEFGGGYTRVFSFCIEK